MLLHHLECWPEISWCRVCTFQHSTVEIKTIPFLTLGLISDSQLIELFSFHDTNTSNTLLSKYFSHLQGCHYRGLRPVSQSQMPPYPPHLCGQQLHFGQVHKQGSQGQRGEHKSHTASSTWESPAASSVTAPTFLSHFPSSKRYGLNPMYIYERLTTRLCRPSTAFSKLGSNLIAPANLPVFLGFAG